MINADQNEAEFRFVAKANGTSEWMWSIYFKYVLVSMLSYMISALLSVYSSRDDLNGEDFYRVEKYV